MLQRPEGINPVTCLTLVEKLDFDQAVQKCTDVRRAVQRAN
jgi:hypothetical protein